jgi:hypothetical protein
MNSLDKSIFTDSIPHAVKSIKGTEGSPVPYNAQPDKNAIKAAVQLLHPTGIVEVRIPNIKGTKNSAAGYFDDIDKLAAAVLAWDTRAESIYITLNELKPELQDRVTNAIHENRSSLTSNDDIARRRYLPIDIDPSRPPKTSSSDEAHTAALELSEKIRDWLVQALGWQVILGDSGNGGHLLVPIDLPKSDETDALIKRCLATIKAKFEVDGLKIDPAVCNAGRVWKLYGTVARKGEASPENPHRRARLLDIPATLVPVTQEQLEVLAALVPASKGTLPQTAATDWLPPATWGSGAYPLLKEDTLLDWIANHSAIIYKTKREADRTIYVLKDCPFDANHSKEGKACITLEDSGKVGFKCQSANCKGFEDGYQQLKELWGDSPYKRIAIDTDADEVDQADETSDEEPASDEKKRRMSQVKRLIEIAQQHGTFFSTPEGERYARVKVGNHYKTLLISERMGTFKLWLIKQFYDANGTSPNATALSQAIGVLESLAQYGNTGSDPESREVFTRIAPVGDTIYLDLADDACTIIEIDAGGWRVAENPPICFRRPNGMLPLPMPVRGAT